MKRTIPPTDGRPLDRPGPALIFVVRALQEWIEARAMLSFARAGYVTLDYAPSVLLGLASASLMTLGGLLGILAVILLLTTLLPPWAAVGVMSVILSIPAFGCAFLAARLRPNHALIEAKETWDA